MFVDFIIDAESDYAAYIYRDENTAYINPGLLLKNFENIRKRLDIDIRDEDFNIFVLQISEICFHEYLHVFGRWPEDLIQCEHGPTDRCYICDLTTRLMFLDSWIKFSMIPSTG